MPSFYEFFAGGGMARAGLEGWKCLFANDFDPRKGEAYTENWGHEELVIQDVKTLEVATLPGRPDLVWASFPCQDLSLAGGGAGLRGDRSGTFWPFWSLLTKLCEDGRSPNFVVLENVCGTLTSHGGKDFVAISKAFSDLNYRFGAIVADAARFVPQSRPRVFFIGVRSDLDIASDLVGKSAQPIWHSAALVRAYDLLPARVAANWIWWDLPAPAGRNSSLAEIIEDEPAGVNWHSREETQRLLAMMSPTNRKKLDEARKAGRRIVGTLYRRGRPSASGQMVQRAEIRFDGIAGCLRTPAGGSSRQTLVVVESKTIRSRLISAREAARLMGLPDHYRLPGRYNEAYHLVGDGVAVPVVRYIKENLLECLLEKQRARLVA